MANLLPLTQSLNERVKSWLSPVLIVFLLFTKGGIIRSGEISLSRMKRSASVASKAASASKERKTPWKVT